MYCSSNPYGDLEVKALCIELKCIINIYIYMNIYDVHACNILHLYMFIYKVYIYEHDEMLHILSNIFLLYEIGASLKFDYRSFMCGNGYFGK